MIDSHRFYVKTSQRGLSELTMYYPGANSCHVWRDCDLPGTSPSFTLSFLITCEVGIVIPVLQRRLLEIHNLPKIIQWVSCEAMTGTQVFWVLGLCFFLSANVWDDWLFIWSCSLSPLAFLPNSLLFWLFVCFYSLSQYPLPCVCSFKLCSGIIRYHYCFIVLQDSVRFSLADALLSTKGSFQWP